MVVMLCVLAYALVTDHRLAGLHALHEPQPLQLVENPVHARAAHDAPAPTPAPRAQRLLDLHRRQRTLLHFEQFQQRVPRPAALMSGRGKHRLGALNPAFAHCRCAHVHDVSAAHPRPSAYMAALIAPTKNPTGQFVVYEAAIAAHTTISAIATDRAIATSGRSVNERAAAGAPIIRLKISSVPTTGTVIVLARASTARNSISIRQRLTPRASPASGRTEEIISGRYSAATARMQRAPRIAVGTMSLLEMPSTSPNRSE